MMGDNVVKRLVLLISVAIFFLHSNVLWAAQATQGDSLHMLNATEAATAWPPAQANATLPEEAIEPPKPIALEEDPLFDEMTLQKGPALQNIGTDATVNVPEGYYFVDGAGAQMVLERTYNLPRGDERGLLFPADVSWFLLFYYSPVGYVPLTEESTKIDVDFLITSFKEDIELENEELKARDWDVVSVVGFSEPPRFDAITKSVEWIVRFKSATDGSEFDTYNFRKFGKNGVLEVVLVSDLMPSQISELRNIIANITFTNGNRYDDYKQGDPVYPITLTNLIADETYSLPGQEPTVTQEQSNMLSYAVGFGVVILGAIIVILRRKKQPAA